MCPIPPHPLDSEPSAGAAKDVGTLGVLDRNATPFTNKREFLDEHEQLVVRLKRNDR